MVNDSATKVDEQTRDVPQFTQTVDVHRIVYCVDADQDVVSVSQPLNDSRQPLLSVRRERDIATNRSGHTLHTFQHLHGSQTSIVL